MNTNYRMAVFVITAMLSFIPSLAWGHHVLGRPAYSLNEDSNTPPSMQVETQMGDYYITYMIFPAFPKPNEHGRINFYAARIDDGSSYRGTVHFSISDKSWFSSDSEALGQQEPDDGVYRQGFVFSESGKYIITASFNDEDVPYVIDFPLQIGKSGPVGILGATVIFLVGVLVFVNVVLRKRLMVSKIKNSHQEQSATVKQSINKAGN